LADDELYSIVIGYMSYNYILRTISFVTISNFIQLYEKKNKDTAKSSLKFQEIISLEQCLLKQDVLSTLNHR